MIYWYVFYLDGKVRRFKTKELAELFADFIGRDKVRSIYSGF